MQITVEPTYTITLTKEEAKLLAHMVQNPVNSEESLQERKLRESIFKAVYPTSAKYAETSATLDAPTALY